MRLRQSNRRTSYALPSYGSDLGDDISDADAAPPQAADQSEDEFVVDAPAPEEEELDSDVEDDQGEEDEVLGDGTDEDENRLAEPEQSTPSNARTKNPKSASRGAAWLDHAVGEEVLPYPTEKTQKWTRVYQGPLPRSLRIDKLIDWWFGDTRNSRAIVNDFVQIWWQHQLLPPKLLSDTRLLKAQSGWMSHNFVQDQRSKFARLYNDRISHQAKEQLSYVIDKEKAYRWLMPLSQGELGVFLGPAFNQNRYSFEYGESISFSDTGMPIASGDPDEVVTGGWMLDVGGITTSMAWAPAQGQVDQLLAIAVVPFADQAYYEKVTDIPRESDRREGTVQILRFESVKDQNGINRPSRKAPRLAHALCFSWGRVSRMQWCPVPLTSEDPSRLLGVLCSDGILRILSIANTSEKEVNEAFQEFERPMVMFKPPGEYSLEITCFTWINMNRVVAGLSDGSVVVWSIAPPQLLQRHAVHSSAIMDIASGFPSDPFVISTTPVGGFIAMTDLRRPSAEATSHPNPSISLQPNMLTWSSHLRGYISLWPSAFSGNRTVTYLSIKQFPTCRHLITSDSQPSCISVGTCHPYLLVGTADGSLWLMSLLHKLSTRKKQTLRLRVFQHEYRPPSLPQKTSAGRTEQTRSRSRGECRILHGFSSEINGQSATSKYASRRGKNSKGTRPGGTKKKGKDRVEDSAEEDGDPEGQDIYMSSGPGPVTVHDPLTRITAVAWNPNVEYSWWAAVAMGSGLLRITDLGVEPSIGEAGDGTESERAGTHDAENDERGGFHENDPSVMDFTNDIEDDDVEEDEDDDSDGDYL